MTEIDPNRDGDRDATRKQGEDAEREQTPTLRDSLAAAARTAGIGQVAPGEAPSGTALLAAIGGVRGLVESILPGLVFLVVYTITGDLLPSVLIPVGVAVVFVIARVISKSSPMGAVAGVIGIGVSAALALFTGNVNDNFVPGLIVNAVSAAILLVSLIARWPLIGVIAGLLTSEGTAWRSDRAKVKVAYITTFLWLGLFALRLGIQAPLYFAEQTAALAATKLIMGVPLYAMVLWVTWLLERSVYRRSAEV